MNRNPMGKVQVAYSHNHDCAQCRSGEIVEPAVVRVSHPNPDHPGLTIREWVCDEHFCMLNDDYGSQLHVVPPPIVAPKQKSARKAPFTLEYDPGVPASKAQPFRCQRCGRRLDPDQIVWLEMDQRTDTYVDPAIVRVPDEQSQGCFPFGADCATILAAEE